MTTTAEVWTTIGLLDHIQNVDRRMEERAFAFILGAGASQAAQIPTNGELVERWLQELQRRLDPDYASNDLAQWATAENLAIPGFEYSKAVTFYAQVFERRFRDDPNEGYTYLSDITEGKVPGIGYLILAQLLTKTRHRIVVTTNQDDLIAQAMNIYAHSSPLIATPADLAKLARPRLRRPLLAKIHQPPFIASDEQGLNSNHWSQPLYRLFEHYTPIVIGYDDDEGGVIELLKQIEPCDTNGGIFWCYQQERGRPNGRIEEIVSRRRGKFVPISDFDGFMQQLGEQFALPCVADEIEQQGLEAAQRYRHRPAGNAAAVKKNASTTPPAISPSISKSPSLKEPATALKSQTDEPKESEPDPAPANPNPGEKADRSAPREGGGDTPVVLKVVSQATPPPAEKSKAGGKASAMATIPDWANWLERINAATDLDAKEALYKEVVSSHPGNATAYGNFAYFMEVERREHEKAEALYRQALNLDDRHTTNIGHFANFMAYARKSYDSAERLYQRAIELAPETALNYTNYAGYLIVINNLPKALKYTKRAWALSQQESGLAAIQAAYYRALIALATRTNARPALGRLKAMLEAGFDYGDSRWHHTPVTTAMKYKLIPEKHALIELIADTIKGTDNSARLDDFADWKGIDPIPLSEAWEG